MELQAGHTELILYVFNGPDKGNMNKDEQGEVGYFALRKNNFFLATRMSISNIFSP
jgi:hypothetical protein